MSLSSERTPNTPLTGPEVMEFILWRFKQAMLSHWIFNEGTAYPRVAFEGSITLQFQNPNLKPVKIQALHTNGPVEGSIPMEGVAAEDSGVHSFTVGDQVENPNACRVNAGIPITLTSVERPKPGQVVGSVVHHKVVYDSHDAPELPPATVVDKSEEVAAKLKLKPKAPPVKPPSRSKAKPADDNSWKSKEDLDAISEEVDS